MGNLTVAVFLSLHQLSRFLQPGVVDGADPEGALLESTLVHIPWSALNCSSHSPESVIILRVSITHRVKAVQNYPVTHHPCKQICMYDQNMLP